MRPLQPVKPGTRIALGISFFILFFVVWAVFTLGGYVSKTFLADPITMLRSGYDLLANQGFIKDIGMTVWRVLGGFAVAALLAIPLGVMMGAYKP
ncbi:MAG: ABC transporter permease, partial [Pseudomonadota bacterium]